MKSPDDIYDELLVMRCQDGDEASMAELVARWQPRLLRQARQLVDDHVEADDVVQACWLVILSGIGRLNDPACFRRWVYRIVVNKSVDWIRRQQRYRHRTMPPHAEPTQPSDLSKKKHFRQELLLEKLNQIPSDRRLLLSMFYLDEMSLREISEALDIPLGTVKSRLYHARLELKQMLEVHFDE